MKELILISIASAWWSEMSNLPQQLKYWLCKKKIWYTKQKVNGKDRYFQRSIKPLDCGKCISFWATLLFINSYTFETFLYACTASALTLFIIKVYNYDYSKSI